MNMELKMVGDWEGGVQKTLQDALHLSILVAGRSGEEATKHGMILMVRSAKARTPKAPARRPVMENARFKHLLTKAQYQKLGKRDPARAYYYKFHAWRLTQTGMVELFANAKGSIAKISRPGLAKRSWTWGLAALGGQDDSVPIPGTWSLGFLKTDRAVGVLKDNALGYIKKIMPGGWENEVENAVVNSIFKRAAMQMGGAWKNAVERRAA